MKNKKNSFKRKISLFLSVFFILQFVLVNTNNVHATVNTGISYTVSGDTKVGSTIEIAVHVSNVKDLYGGSIDFLYDPSILQVEIITKGAIFGSKTVLTPLGVNGQINNGQASFAVTLKGNTSGIIETNGTIAIIKAKVLKAGTVNLNTTSDNSNLNLNGNTIRVKLSNATANSISYTATNESISLTEDVVSSTVALNTGTYQENNPALVYSGNWLS
ncbi:cohesin domain-containing protein, partial [Clostridium sp.]|uniref:cohesin domain-containing protein n=1 Tax=Clostridium sp. TaxID=1506 RepID=UPI003990B8F6